VTRRNIGPTGARRPALRGLRLHGATAGQATLASSRVARFRNETPMRIIAILLIVLGALALIYGGFSYTQDRTAAKLGPIELNVKETKTVPIPMWAGIAGIVVGGFLLVAGGRR